MRSFRPLSLLAGLLAGAAAVLLALPTSADSATIAARSVDNLKQLLTELVKADDIVGGSALLQVRGSRPVIVSAGLADRGTGTAIREDTIFRIYSMTKPIVAVAVMQLVERGTLALDDRVDGWIPELGGLRVAAGGGSTVPLRRPMTIHDLLTHSAGFTASFQTSTPLAARYVEHGLVAGQWIHRPEIGGLAGFVSRLGQLPLAFQPGTQWHYGVSYDVLGLVIERVTGMSLGGYLHREVSQPLGMVDTGFRLDPQQRPRLATLYAYNPAGAPIEVSQADATEAPAESGGGGLYSTIRDYYRFACMLAHQGESDGARILQPESVRRLMTDQLGHRFGPTPLANAAQFGIGGHGAGLGFGYGGAVITDVDAHGGLGARGEYSWGGAASTTFWIDTTNGVIAIIMTQLVPSGSLAIRDRARAAVYDQSNHDNRPDDGPPGTDTP